MREINLTQGQVALVDGWRYEELIQHKWHARWDKHTKSFYAYRKIMDSGKEVMIAMHSQVANTPKGMKTDHINHSTLDNREENLRVCTNAQNLSSRGKNLNNTSGYKGVIRKGSRWQAKIGVNGKRVHLHCFDTPEEAARAYDKAAKELHGDFAVLNFGI